ncbi:MAG: type II secretion system GspH family protein [Defluviitaleaceae bacterium]|nr:type II secretion system GspH family protein [Defluviitaleaceae bacterium]
MKKRLLHLSAGFTLIELVIVLGIVAILGSATLITSRSIERRTLTNAALALQADFRHAQRMALIESRRWQVVFSLDYNRYVVRPSPTLQNRASLSYTVYLPHGVRINYINANANTVVYLPRGTINSGFTISLRSNNYQIEMTGTVSGGRIAIREIQRLHTR